MAMVNVVYWLPTGRLMAQANWLGPKRSAAIGAVSAFIA